MWHIVLELMGLLACMQVAVVATKEKEKERWIDTFNDIIASCKHASIEAQSCMQEQYLAKHII